MQSRVAAFWCRIPSRPNFGDALTPWLIRRFTGTYPGFLWPGDPRPKYFITGSIAGLAQRACTVWGSGIMNAGDRINPEAVLLAVRGPLTRANALASGAACPETIGDPALLLPRLYQPASGRRRGIGLALHFSDYPRMLTARDRPHWIRHIDMQDPIETVIDRLCTCELVATSSLHGLIASHAYGIPATWLEFRTLPSGDGTKFRDYLQAIGRERDQPLRVSPAQLDPEFLYAHAIEPPSPADLDLEALWHSCPLRGIQ